MEYASNVRGWIGFIQYVDNSVETDCKLLQTKILKCSDIRTKPIILNINFRCFMKFSSTRFMRIILIRNLRLKKQKHWRNFKGTKHKKV